MKLTESTKAMKSMELIESMKLSVIYSCWLKAISKSNYLY